MVTGWREVGRRAPGAFEGETPASMRAPMPSATLVNLSALPADAKCYALVRQHRWPEGVR